MRREDVEWLRELPYTISLPSLHAVVVHAGLMPEFEATSPRPFSFSSSSLPTFLCTQSPNTMTLMRNIVTEVQVEAEATTLPTTATTTIKATGTTTEKTPEKGRHHTKKRSEPAAVSEGVCEGVCVSGGEKVVVRKSSDRVSNGEAWALVWDRHQQQHQQQQQQQQQQQHDIAAPMSMSVPVHVYFGHDAKRGLQRHIHSTGLDTGACYGAPLHLTLYLHTTSALTSCSNHVAETTLIITHLTHQISCNQHFSCVFVSVMILLIFILHILCVRSPTDRNPLARTSGCASAGQTRVHQAIVVGLHRSSLIYLFRCAHCRQRSWIDGCSELYAFCSFALTIVIV